MPVGSCLHFKHENCLTYTKTYQYSPNIKVVCDIMLSCIHVPFTAVKSVISISPKAQRTGRSLTCGTLEEKDQNAFIILTLIELSCYRNSRKDFLHRDSATNPQQKNDWCFKTHFKPLKHQTTQQRLVWFIRSAELLCNPKLKTEENRHVIRKKKKKFNQHVKSGTSKRMYRSAQCGCCQ